MKHSDRATLFSGILLSSAVLTMPAAKAYIDPSVTTYAIQAIVGVVIAVGAVAAVWWRKAKRKVAKTLNINDSKGKSTEAELKEIKPDDDDDD